MWDWDKCERSIKANETLVRFRATWLETHANETSKPPVIMSWNSLCTRCTRRSLVMTFSISCSTLSESEHTRYLSHTKFFLTIFAASLRAITSEVNRKNCKIVKQEKRNRELNIARICKHNPKSFYSYISTREE